MTQRSSAKHAPDTPPAGPVQGPDAMAAAVAALLHAAHREVRLFGPQLRAAVFGSAPVGRAVVRFLTQHPRNRMRIQIENVAQVRGDNDRLIELARRLADPLELRTLDAADRGARDLYLVADRSASLVQEDMSRDDAVVTRDPFEAIRLIERFDATWERAEPVALRTLGL